MSSLTAAKNLAEKPSIEAPERRSDEVMTGLLFVIACTVIVCTGLALMFRGAF